MEEKETPISNMKELFKHIKIMNKLKSDRECWELIKISKSHFYKVREGKEHLSNEKAHIIAIEAKLSHSEVLLLISREKATTDAERAAWNSIINSNVA